MKDPIEREDAIKYCKSKAEHYRKRLARIEAQGDAIGYDPTAQIKGFKDEIAIYESFVKELEEIPSAEKQGEWIPCSERLPSADYDVLVQYEDCSMAVDCITGTAHGWEMSEFPYLPIAWQLLPEPWKGVDDE